MARLAVGSSARPWGLASPSRLARSSCGPKDGLTHLPAVCSRSASSLRSAWSQALSEAGSEGESPADGVRGSALERDESANQLSRSEQEGGRHLNSQPDRRPFSEQRFSVGCSERGPLG